MLASIPASQVTEWIALYAVEAAEKDAAIKDAEKNARSGR